MPRNVRNFWIELQVEGRKTTVATGPVDKTGGISMRIYQRNKGGIIEALNIDGYAYEDGTLELKVIPSFEAKRRGQNIEVITER